MSPKTIVLSAQKAEGMLKLIFDFLEQALEPFT
jgi:hypothetical protein